MQKTLILYILLAFLQFGGWKADGQTQKPNIIFILADDIGYKTIGCNGNSRYETPNLDTMARQGMRFTQCHSSPLCSPSRHALLTGKYNFRNYVQWGIMNPNQRTFANQLKDAGYKTACYGKWQLDGGDKSIHAFGFDNYTIWEPYQVSNDVRIYKNPEIYQNGSTLPDSLTLNKYGEDIFNDSLLNFIDSNKALPFFIYYPMVLAHLPFQPTPDDSIFNTWDPRREDTLYYKSMIKYMDKKVGEVIKKVKSLGLENNTIIIYAGDNGTPSKITEPINDDYAPGGKGSATEAGTHVPLIAYCPGKIAAGVVNSDLIEFTDFLPTFAGIANIPVPTTYGPLDGVSFAPALLGQQGTPREWIFDHYSAFLDQTVLKRWVQTKTYKLYDYYGKYSFYNIENDIQEKHSLTDATLTPAELQIKQTLRQVLDKYAQISAPEIKSPTVTDITDSSARLGATLLKPVGVSTITERGTSFNNEGGKAFDNLLLINALAEGSTAVSSFSHLRTGMSPQTLYFFKGYSKNAYGVGVSPIGNFRTLSKPVIAGSSTFAAYAGTNSVTLNWSSAKFPGSGATNAGYVLIYSTETPSLIASPDAHAPDAIINKGTLIATISVKLPVLPQNSTIISGLPTGAGYHFILVPYTWDGKNPATYNYFTDSIKTANAVTGQATLTWIGGQSGSWTTPSNWYPNKIPADSDNIQFTSHVATIVSDIPNITLARLAIGDSSAVTFRSTAKRTIQIAGGISNQFLMASNSSLTLDGANPISITLLKGNKASISGTLQFKGAAHRLTSDDDTSIVFTSTAKFIAGDLSSPGYIGSPFGTSGADSVVIFNDGSSYIQNEGSSPFGLTSPLTRVVFKPESNYYYRTGGSTSPQMSGRKFGNVFIQNNTAAIANASSATELNYLNVQSGSSFTFNGTSSNKVIIKGNIVSDGDASINITPGSGGIQFNSGSVQNIGGGGGSGSIALNNVIIPPGTTVNLLRNVSTSLQTIVNGTLNCGSFVVSGSGSFTLSASGTLVIGSPEGLSSSAAAGNIQTASRSFSSAANYVYNGTLNQATGIFITNPKPATVNSLKFLCDAGVVLSSNITAESTGTVPYALSLTKGSLNLNSFNITIGANGKVNSEGGNFSGTTGSLIFAGDGVISGTVTIPNVVISKGVNFGNGSTIASTLKILDGGYVSKNAPFYSKGSSLIYSTGSIYKRNLEWSGQSGQGFPDNVVVQAGTTLDLSANDFANRSISGNLLLGSDDGPGSVTLADMPKKLTVQGNIIIGGNAGVSTLTLSTKPDGDLWLGGAYTRNSNGVFSPNGRVMFLNGIDNQLITTSGGESFANLSLLKNAGSVILTDDLSITNTLTFISYNNGNIVTNGHSLFISNGNPASISWQGNGYVIGSLKRAISPGSGLSYSYPIGTLKGYTPVNMVFANVTSPGNFSALSVDGDHPLLPASINVNKSINRYWKLLNDGVVFSNYVARFSFLPGDKDAPTNIPNIIAGKYNGNEWFYPATGTKKPSYVEVTGETGFGDFAFGEPGCVPPVITGNVTNAVCDGTSTGSILVNTSGGSVPLTFSWSGPGAFSSSSQSISNLSAGAYHLTVNSRGCIVSKDFQVTEPGPISLSTSFNPVACHGGTTDLTVSASGGTTPYMYSLFDGTNTTGPQVSNTFAAKAGTYTVTAQDSAHCIASKVVTVDDPLPVNIDVHADSISCNAGTTNIVVAASGGTGTYLYSLSDGINSTGPQAQNTFVAKAGTYTVTAGDAQSCSCSKTITINEPAPIDISAFVDPASYHNDTATLTINASGGTGKYLYSLFDGTNTFGPTAANTFVVHTGTYTIIVKDSLQCSSSKTVTVSQPPPPIVFSTGGTFENNNIVATREVSANRLNYGFFVEQTSARYSAPVVSLPCTVSFQAAFLTRFFYVAH